MTRRAAPPSTTRGLSRRQFLAGVAGAGMLAGCRRVVDAAHHSDPAGSGSLSDIDHIVLLMHENRSFDHYFGAMSGVRGFDDLPAQSAQPGFDARSGANPAGRLAPFPLRSAIRGDSDVLFDPDHSWQVQHASWHAGAMDDWIKAHLAIDGPAHAPEIMGYYTRADLPIHYELADAFTVCDHYFSSAMGPTAPNRMYWMTGTMDPEGTGGGPILAHSSRTPLFSLQWPTFPEVLTDAGVSWKVYNARGVSSTSELSGMLKYFHAYRDPASELYARGIAPRLNELRTDVEHGTLPAVSWVIPAYPDSEHPSYPPAIGADGIIKVLDIFASNPEVWGRTLLLVSYDENGGFFDHVAPPTPSFGTAGEFIADAARHGVAADAPIGLGFRVPALLISPYTRGGRVFSDITDHTSQLKLIARRFGVPVPNLSAWRDGTVGDFAGAVQSRAIRGAPSRSPVSGTAAAREALDDVQQTVHARGGQAPPLALGKTSPPRQDLGPPRGVIPTR